MKELDEIEADLKEFEIVVQNIPVYQRPVKEIGGFTSSQAAREEYNRVMQEYAALLKENGQTDSNFWSSVRYAAEKGGVGLQAAVESLMDAGAAVLADERMGKALRYAAPSLGLIQTTNELFDQLGILPDGASFDELAGRWLSASPSQEELAGIESRYAPGKVGRIAGDVSQAVGGMIPSVAANVFLPGAGYVVTGIQAGGQNAQQAYQEGATLEEAVNFGVLSGALEAATEALFGGIAGIGKGFLDDAVGKAAGELASRLGISKAGKVLSALSQNGIVKRLASSLGEGVEGILPTLLTPYLARLTYDEDAANATADEIAYNILIEGLTSLVFQGVSGFAGNKKAASGEAASKYTKEEANAIRYEGKTFRNLVAGIDATVSEFFSRWAGGRKSHMGEKLEKLYLGKMPDEIKEEVSGILGYEVTERDFIVTNDDVKHIMDRHGNPAAEIRKGNLPLDQWALDVLPEVVTAPDAVKKGYEGTGRNKGKTGVVISKSFPNGRVVSVQYDNKGRRTLEITTIYAKESTTSMVNAPKETNTFTSKTTEPVLSLKPMIQQRKGKVNESQLEQDPFLQGFNEEGDGLFRSETDASSAEGEFAFRMNDLAAHWGEEEERAFLEGLNESIVPEKKAILGAAKEDFRREKNILIEKEKSDDKMGINIQLFAERDIAKQTSASIRKSFQKYEKRILEHQRKIAEPRSYVENWDRMDSRRKEGLVRHWEKEIRYFQRSIDERMKELKRRGDL